MAEIKIESGVPIPPVDRKGSQPGKPIYPWKRMSVGDSFLVHLPIHRVTAAAWREGNSSGNEFTCRQIGAATRVWRTA